MTASTDDQRAAIRRTLGWILVASLCVASLTAIVAILSGDFDDNDWRVIGTSLGFGVFSALGATGMSLRLRESEALQTLGLATVALSAVSYLLLVGGIWDDESEEIWRWFGIFGLATFAASHASLVSGARRDTDGDAVRGIATASIVLSCIDSSLGILALAEAFEDVDEGFAQLAGVLVVLMLLTTALPPIMRRLQTPAARPEPDDKPLLALADRLEALNADPGNRAPEIRRELERLRALARSYGE